MQIICGCIPRIKPKKFLNIWNFIILFLGICLLSVTSYVYVFEKDRVAIPTLAYDAALFSGGILILVSTIGIYGLYEHKKKMAKGKRNCALTLYVIISGIASGCVILAGLIALSMNGIVENARANEFGEKNVKYLEQAIINKLANYAREEAGDWKKIQNALFCCGYDDPHYIDNYLAEDYFHNVTFINSVAGTYCTDDKSVCGDLNSCPQQEKKWCRQEFLDKAYNNSISIGFVAVAMGFSQVLAFLVSLYVLLCDVRGATEFQDLKEIVIDEAQELNAPKVFLQETDTSKRQETK